MAEYRTTRPASRVGNVDRAIGIIAIVLGILIVLGEFSFGWLLPVLGVVLLVLGILILARLLAGTTALGVTFVVLGILLFADFLSIPTVLGRVLDLVIGVALIVVGILKLT